MLTVKQAKKKGVVFVEGDAIDGVTVSNVNIDRINELSYWDGLVVTSFTDRKHTGNKMPCVKSLPVDVKLRNSGAYFGIADSYPWRNIFVDSVVSWKPDIEALEKIAKEKEEKAMTPTRSKSETAIKTLEQSGYKFKGGELWEPPVVIPQKHYTYELVTDLSTNEIAKAMIDGEVFYSANGKFEYKWLGNRFNFNLFNDEFYRRKEIEMITRTITYPKPVSEPLNDGDMYFIIDISGVVKLKWNNNSANNDLLKQDRVHLTRENAQVHWDAVFGGK